MSGLVVVAAASEVSRAQRMIRAWHHTLHLTLNLHSPPPLLPTQGRHLLPTPYAISLPFHQALIWLFLQYKPSITPSSYTKVYSCLSPLLKYCLSFTLPRTPSPHLYLSTYARLIHTFFSYKKSLLPSCLYSAPSPTYLLAKRLSLSSPSPFSLTHLAHTWFTPVSRLLRPMLFIISHSYSLPFNSLPCIMHFSHPLALHRIPDNFFSFR